AGLPDLIVDAGSIQVINCGAVVVDVFQDILAIVSKVCRSAIRSGSLNASSQRIVFVTDTSARGCCDLSEPIFKIPSEARRLPILGLSGQITVVVIDITCRAGTHEAVARLVGVDGAALVVRGV